MPAIQEMNGMGPLPRFMPDMPEPDYDRILEHLAGSPISRIGASFFYLRTQGGCVALCRIVHGGGKIFFHETMDHRLQGITDSELEEAVRNDPGIFAEPGYYLISPLIESKLRLHAAFR